MHWLTTCSYIDRIYKYLTANYGSLSGTKFKMSIEEQEGGGLTSEGRSKLKDIFNQIMQKEIARTYKIPQLVRTHPERGGTFKEY